MEVKYVSAVDQQFISVPVDGEFFSQFSHVNLPGDFILPPVAPPTEFFSDFSGVVPGVVLDVESGPSSQVLTARESFSWRSLRSAKLFAALSDEEVAEISGRVQSAHFGVGEAVRDGAQAIHLVVTGRVEFIAHDIAGDPHVIGTAGPGDFFGEHSFLTRRSSGVVVRARDEVTTLLIDEPLARELLQDRRVLISLAEAVAERTALLTELLNTKTVGIDLNAMNAPAVRFLDRAADRMSGFLGSWTFFCTELAVGSAWLAWNTFGPTALRFDPYPYMFLNWFLSAQGALCLPVLSISSNRQSNRDRVSQAITQRVTNAIFARLERMEQEIVRAHQPPS